MNDSDREDSKNNLALKKVVLFLTYTLILIIAIFVGSMFYETMKSNQAISQKTEGEKQLNSTPNVNVTPIVESETIMNTVTPQPIATPDLLPHIPYGKPENFGFNQSKINIMDNYIQAQVDDGFPGAALMIAKDGHIVFDKSYGYSKKYNGINLMSEFEGMQIDTIFDLASLTKIYASTFAIMKLVDDGLVSLDGKVSDYLQDYNGGYRNQITVQMLLSHNAGYIENYKFYSEDSEYRTRDRDTVYDYVKKIPVDRVPGEKYDYNNLNYIIIGMIVEEVSGMRIDEYLKKNVYEPLNIDDKVTYAPLEIGIDISNIAATERLGNTRDGLIDFDGIRQYTIQGEVHDENTYYCMDQVSGHAGLFANSYGLTVLNQLLLNKGEYEGVRIYKEETIDNWLTTINDEKYQLGFWNAKNASEKLEPYVSDTTFYHNGWTGTATIVDKENNMSIILLTNKRHSPCPEGDFQGMDYSLAYYVSLIQKVYSALED